MKNYFGGGIIGGVGAGKTESAKDLAQAFGYYMININCNQEIGP